MGSGAAGSSRLCRPHPGAACGPGPKRRGQGAGQGTGAPLGHRATAAGRRPCPAASPGRSAGSVPQARSDRSAKAPRLADGVGSGRARSRSASVRGAGPSPLAGGGRCPVSGGLACRPGRCDQRGRGPGDGCARSIAVTLFRHGSRVRCRNTVSGPGGKERGCLVPRHGDPGARSATGAKRGATAGSGRLDVGATVDPASALCRAQHEVQRGRCVAGGRGGPQWGRAGHHRGRERGQREAAGKGGEEGGCGEAAARGVRPGASRERRAAGALRIGAGRTGKGSAPSVAVIGSARCIGGRGRRSGGAGTGIGDADGWGAHCPCWSWSPSAVASAGWRGSGCRG